MQIDYFPFIRALSQLRKCREHVCLELLGLRSLNIPNGYEQMLAIRGGQCTMSVGNRSTCLRWVRRLKGMLSHSSRARQKHREHLDELKVEEAVKKRKMEKEAAEAETQELRSKRSRLQQDILEMEKSANKLSEDAEKFGRLTLIAESNAIRRRVVEKKAEMVTLEKTIQERDKMASGPSSE